MNNHKEFDDEDLYKFLQEYFVDCKWDELLEGYINLILHKNRKFAEDLYADYLSEECMLDDIEENLDK